MTSPMIYCAGPYATPEDRWQLDELETTLRSRGFKTYLPFRDGLDSLYQDLSFPDERIRADLARSLFSINVFRLLEKCEAVIFSMNGRVPDAGGIVVSAVAAVSGIPVVIYKQDYRSTFHGHDNAMITGLSRTFSTTTSLKGVAGAVKREISLCKGSRIRQLPTVLEETISLGRMLDEMLDGFAPPSSADATALLKKVQAVFNNFTEQQSMRVGTVESRGLVYCSGPLFCPGEVEVMDEIARSLESSGWKTYLPHRDGVESFVMKNTDNYMANLFQPLVRFFHRLTFAVDLYYLLKCGCLVFNMNGRVPDEGGVAEIGMAFAAGKPVFLYRESTAGTGMDFIDPMIAAIGVQARPVASIEQIPGQLMRIDPARYRADDLTEKDLPLLPPHMQRLVRLGRKANQIMNRLAFIKPQSLFSVKAPVSTGVATGAGKDR